jgi:hypothetical protein
MVNWINGHNVLDRFYDDTARLQDIINMTPPDGSLVLHGNFRITEQLFVKKSISILGPGTIFADFPPNYNLGIFYIQADNVLISNLDLDISRSSNGYGVSVRSGNSGLAMQYCNIRLSARNTIMIDENLLPSALLNSNEIDAGFDLL